MCVYGRTHEPDHPVLDWAVVKVVTLSLLSCVRQSVRRLHGLLFSRV